MELALGSSVIFVEHALSGEVHSNYTEINVLERLK